MDSEEGRFPPLFVGSHRKLRAQALALNKRKVLDAARKFAQKGAKEKALKEYAKLLQADSRDAKLLLEIGDTHRRWGQNEEAISHYSRVADQYKQGGFDARAVAVFKQILNLDSKRYPAYVSLAELYQRMGLDAEAVHALQTAADGYHKEGQKHEALELLRKMATLDPSNTTSRLKVAELLRQEELLDDAVAEYEAVVDEMVRQGVDDALIPVYERILEVQPERADIEFALGRILVQQSQSDRAEPLARRAFDRQPDGEGYFDLLTGIYTELGKTDELSEVTKTMARLCRDRGDEDRARVLMQRLPNELSLELSDASLDEDSSADETVLDDELLDDGFLDDDLITGGDDDDDDSFIDLDGDDVLDVAVEGPVDSEVEQGDSSASGTTLPEGDPEQLFAEASVYLRYGKRDQAIASLEAILVQEPQHRDALEKIGEFYADDGDSSKAVAHWVEAATLARAAGDDSAFEILCERIEVLDPSAAEQLAPAPPQFVEPPETSLPAPDAVAPDLGVDPEIELDMECDDGENVPGLDTSIELDEITLDDSISQPDVEQASRDASTVVEFDDSSSASVSASASLSGGVSEAAVSAPGSLSTSSTHSQQIAEDLEEAEFYMEQDLMDEAEAIYKRVLEIAPNHPSALLRLGELRAERGEDPSASAEVDPPVGDVTLDPADLPFDQNEQAEGDECEFDANDEESSVELGADSELEIAVDIDNEQSIEVAADEDALEDEDGAHFEIDVDVDTDVDVGLDADVGIEIDVAIETDAAPELEAANSENTPADIGTEVEVDIEASEEPLVADDDETNLSLSDSVATGPDELSASGESDEVEIDFDDVCDEEEPPHDTTVADSTMPIVAESESEPAQTDEDDSFDLAAELRETLEEEEEREDEGGTTGSSETTSEDEGFASIFKDFKSGVEKTLADDDYETRFDLGIAYRGMELYEDALSEFRICLESDGHRLESLHMMGLCAIDVGRFADASSHLEQALASGDLPAQKEAGLHFDLARSFEGLEDHARAKVAFEAAQAIDPSIPGIDDSIARVTEHAASGDAPVELEAVRSDADSTEGEGDAAERFENFDDLVADVEAESHAEETFEPPEDEQASVEDATADEAAVVAEEDTEAAPTDGVPKKRKKKKRISFV